MSERVVCEICGRPVPTGESYVVRIDVYADPTMPPLTTEELAEMDLEQTMADLLKQMQNMTTEELQDQVHRRFEYRLCRSCQVQFLVNPLGLPRRKHTSGN